MNEAVRGDFERLRARRQRRGRVGEKPAVPAPERIVLTPPPRTAVEPEAPPVEPAAATQEAAESSPVERRSWLRSVLRRG